MSGWLGKATQGLTSLNEQLKEFTTEVLTDAAEESPDEKTELQVAKKRISELEGALQGKDGQVASLASANEFLAEQARLLESRLAHNAELLRVAQASPPRAVPSLEVETFASDALEASPPSSPDGFEIQSLREEVGGLKAEVAHWKSLARTTPQPDPAELTQLTGKVAELEAQLAAANEQKESAGWTGDEGWEEASFSGPSVPGAAEKAELEEALRESASEATRLRAELGEAQENLETLDAQHQEILLNLMETKKKEVAAATADSAADADRREHLEKELTQIKAENSELTAAYNDLNDELEKNKAESGSIVHSHQEMSDKLESLQADLIEYEEKYEKCKTANASSLKQMDDLTAELEKLKAEMGKGFDVAEDYERLKSEVVGQLESAVEEKDALLAELRSEVAALQEAQEAVQVRLAEDALAEASSEWRGRAEAAEEELGRLRVSTDVAGLSPGGGGGGGGSSSEGSGDSNGWDRLGPEEGDAAAASSALAGGKGLSRKELEAQLKEALAALTEKTEECEKMSKAVAESAADLHEKDDLLQQVFTELKGLELQIFEYKEREESLRNQLQKLTQETSTKDREIDDLRNDLESASETVEEMKLKLLQEEENNTQLNETHALELHKLEGAASDGEAKLSAKTAELAALQEQLGKAGENESDAVRQASERADEAATQLTQLSSELDALRTEKDQLVTVSNEKHAEVMRYYEETQKSQAALQEKETESAAIRGQLDVLSAEHESLQGQLAKVQSEKLMFQQSLNEMSLQLQQASGRSDEAQRLSSELSIAAQAQTRLQAELEAERRQREAQGGELGTRAAALAKTERELERLRAHLVQTEENYTAEALAAEEREAELRSRLRELEGSVAASTATAEESSASLSTQMQDMRLELSTAAAQRDAALLQLSETQDDLHKSDSALKSLQSVLQQFQTDQDSLLSQEVKRFKDQLGNVIREKAEVASRLSAAESELAAKASEWVGSTALRDELGRREAAVAELEAELRTRDAQMADLRASASKLHRGEGEKVDKDILRNLFMSYFTAPGDKKPQVAELVASVLGFSPEERKKMLGVGSGSWLPFLGSKSSDAGAPDSSITAQFIRFLEDGSKAAAAPPPPPSLLSHAATPAPPPALQMPTFAKDSALLASAETSDFLKSALLAQPSPPKT